MNKNFHIYRSSAGSGKTYMLALNFIKLSLEGYCQGNVKYYQRILAITFTNKAASEMKERILLYLHELSYKRDVDGILKRIKNDMFLNEDIIVEGSQQIYNHIIHNYTNLSISTIDKFTTHVVRSFSKDLNLSYNFDLELDEKKIIEPVVALLLNSVSKEGGDLSEVLVNFSLSKAEEGKISDIESDLQDFSKELFKEHVFGFLESKDITIKEYLNSRKFIYSKKEKSLKKIHDLRREVCSYFKQKGIGKEHFVRGTYYKYFTNHLNSLDDKKWIPTKVLIDNVLNDIWYSARVDSEIKSLITSCTSDLRNFFNSIMELLTEYYSCKSILENIYSIAVLSELQKRIRKYKYENNIEQLSEFNKKINTIVSNEPATFIYERIGERYHHYLIDEFQDTSRLQWQNLLPLIVDSLDYGKTFLVGDSKQSIYRWRGGEVEQFLQLPDIYHGENLLFLNDWQKKMHNHFEEYNLSFNFRSRIEIIDFNNIFFNKLTPVLDASLQDMYANNMQQKEYAKEGGYIHVELFGEDHKDYKELVLQKIVSEINELVTNHECSFKDITILCNTSKRVSLVASHLSANSIPVVSNDGLLLSSSPKVNFLILILTYLNDSNDIIVRTAIITYLYKYKLKETDLHLLYKKAQDINDFNCLLKQANINLNQNKILTFPFYEMIENIIANLKLKKDIYIQFFLDFVFTYSKKTDCNLPSFLRYWNDRENKESIVIPEGIDAVQIMTIHKSKGLAFNNVIIPFNWEDTKNVNNIWIDTSSYFHGKIPSALIRSNSNLQYTYFHQQYIHDRNLRLLDNLNKLYVAMTRARDRLYIFSKKFPNKTNDDFINKGYLNSFLYKYSNNYPITKGRKDNISNNIDDPVDLFSVNIYEKRNWRDVIRLKHSAEKICDLEQKKIKIDWGKLFHRVLADIHYIEEKDKVMDNLVNLGECSQEEYAKLKVSIDNFFSSKDVAKYFNDEWYVKTEREILMPNGKIYIPDRLLFRKESDEVVIIDYKTGEEREKDKEQILNYSGALMKMGYTNVKRVLIYTNQKINIIKV